MQKSVLAAVLLLALAAVAQAASGRDLLAKCRDEDQLRCGGKCKDIFWDENHCGQCNKKCGGTFECRMGGCVCSKKTPDLCAKRCTSIQKDPFNCGYCGNICPSGQCVRGQCVGGDDGCPVYQKRCWGTCKDVLHDERNCGNCGVRCTGGTFCARGGCICPRDQPDSCGRPARCTNKETDESNCGFCGNKCGRGKRCSKGKCVRRN